MPAKSQRVASGSQRSFVWRLPFVGRVLCSCPTQPVVRQMSFRHSDIAGPSAETCEDLAMSPRSQFSLHEAYSRFYYSPGRSPRWCCCSDIRDHCEYKSVPPNQAQR